MPESISKTRVSADVGERIAVDAFGPGTRLAAFEELTDGWFSVVYALTLEDGRRCVLKVAPPPEVTVLRYEHDIMAAEVAALECVAARTSAPVPRVLWSDTSCRHVPSALFVMELVGGAPLNVLRPALDAEQQLAVDAALARFLREMHAIEHATFGLQAPSAMAHRRWSGAFIALVDAVLLNGEDAAVALPVPYDRLRQLVRADAALLDEVTVPCFVHWDLWDGNVFVDPDTNEVTGLIDFERGLWGDPLMELQFATRRADAAFVAAYGRDLLDTPGARRRRGLYDLYLFLVMTVEATYRRYPTDDLERYARGRLATTLAALGIG